MQSIQNLVILSMLLLLTACGEGENGSGNSPADGTSIDLATGGIIVTDAGADVEILSGAGQGEVTIAARVSGKAGEILEDGAVVSAEYDFTVSGLDTASLNAPFLVTVPVDATALPAPVNAHAFYAEAYDPDSDQWIAVNGYPTYDEEAHTVTFQAEHFSRYRVIYLGFDPRVQLNQYRYATDHFRIDYYLPVSFGASSKYEPWDDVTWAGKGSGAYSDPDAPNYIEDVATALEMALTYLTSIRGSNGAQLFTTPSDKIEVNVTYVKDAGGMTWLGGPIALRSQLDDWREVQATAAHELVHVLTDQHYTTLGAMLNKWFFEAIANLWSGQAANLTDDQARTYYSKEMSKYLSVSLDTSDEGSYYAAADFLAWLERKTGNPLAADVVLADYSFDLTGLNTLVSTGGATLDAYFEEYVRNCALGDGVLKPGYIWKNRSFTDAERGWRFPFGMLHLSAAAVTIRSNAAVNGLLVATAQRHVPGIKLKTFSYTGAALDLNAYLEKLTAAGRPVIVKHFGKAGTPGVTASEFNQVIVNPEITDETVWSTYTFDYYLLEPPQEQLPRNVGGVSWTFNGQGIPYNSPYETGPVKGFNVYLNGQKLNESLVGGSIRSFSNSRIGANDTVTVTVVDHYNNEWPEVTPVQSGLLSKLQGTRGFESSFEGYHTIFNGSYSDTWCNSGWESVFQIRSQTAFDFNADPIVWNGNEVSYDYRYDDDLEPGAWFETHMKATFSADGRTLVSVHVKNESQNSNGGGIDEYTLTNLPITRESDYEYIFSISGPEAAGHISGIDLNGNRYQGTDYNRADCEARVFFQVTTY